MSGRDVDADPKQSLRAFILKDILFGAEMQIGDDDSLLVAGVLDSSSVMDMVAFLEETYGFTIADEEISVDNFDSINRVSRLIASKRPA